MKLIADEEVEHYTKADWGAVLIAVGAAMVITVVLVEYVFGAENIIEWVSNLFV